MSHPANELSILRLSVMRLAFFLNFAFLGMNVVTSYIDHTGPWQSGSTIAMSLWGTLSLLSLIGLMHPQKMLPALLFQFTYKTIWALAFYLPGLVPPESGLEKVMLGGIVADVIFIPWIYVLRTFILAPSERWTNG